MKATLIDTTGKEWIYGKFDTVFPPKYGWAHTISKSRGSKRHAFIQVATGKIFSIEDTFPSLAQYYSESIPYIEADMLTPDYCKISVFDPYNQGGRSPLKTTYVWSISNHCFVIPPTRILVLNYIQETGLFYVVSPENHAQIRGANNDIVADLGHVEGETFLLETKDDYYELYSREFICGISCYRYWDFDSGKKHDQCYRSVGALNEGLRYVRKLDGTECFINERGDYAFSLLPCVNIHEIYFEQDKPFLSEKALERGCVEPLVSPPTRRYIGSKHLFCEGGRIAVLYHNPDYYNSKFYKEACELVRAGYAVAVKREQKKSCSPYLVASDGNMVIPPWKYTDILSLGAGRIALVKGEKISIADGNGIPLTDFDFAVPRSQMKYFPDIDFGDHVGYYGNGLCSMQKQTSRGCKWGCVDTTGKEQIPFIKSFPILRPMMRL